MKIRNRAREINIQRAEDAKNGITEGVEQIQLHAVEPGTTMQQSMFRPRIARTRRSRLRGQSSRDSMPT